MLIFPPLNVVCSCARIFGHGTTARIWPLEHAGCANLTEKKLASRDGPDVRSRHPSHANFMFTCRRRTTMAFRRTYTAVLIRKRLPTCHRISIPALSHATFRDIRPLSGRKSVQIEQRSKPVRPLPLRRKIMNGFGRPRHQGKPPEETPGLSRMDCASLRDGRRMS
jgi:hypothetical protein